MSKLSLFLLVMFFTAVLNAQESKQEKPDQYNIPVFFNPANVGVKQRTFAFEWDLSDKNTLKLGSLNLNSDSFIAAFFDKNNKSHPLLGTGSKIENKNILLLIWPTDLVKEGVLELIGRDGSILWSTKINKNEIRDWKSEVNQLKAKASEEKRNQNAVLFRSSIAISDLDSEVLSSISGSFRFCLSDRKNRTYAMLCSSRHIVAKSSDGLTLSRIAETVEPRVLINKNNESLSGSKLVKPGQLFSFFSETGTSLSYEFASVVLAPSVLDIFKDKDGEVIVSGVDPVPFGSVIYEGKNDEDTFWNRVGWEQTLGDIRNYWQMPLAKDFKLTVPGKPGGAFTVQFEAENLPNADDRVWISNKDVKATYNESKRLHVYSGDKKLQARNGDIVAVANRPGEAIWNFPAAKKSQYNLASVDIVEDSKVIPASYEIFRGSSAEISARFSAVLGSSTLLIGELQYSKWFENLWGWDHDLFSNLRWGLALNYFKSLTDVKVNESSTTVSTAKSSFDITSANMKYRFNPGLWGRDETWGIIAGYYDLTISEIKAPILGTGVFWARSMPRIIDSWFSYLPFMDRPKFVDMELIAFPASLDSNIKLGSSYAINFHGKVLWTNDLFGEGGFGVRNYTLRDQARDIAIGMNSFYFTLGLGLNF